MNCLPLSLGWSCSGWAKAIVEEIALGPNQGNDNRCVSLLSGTCRGGNIDFIKSLPLEPFVFSGWYQMYPQTTFFTASQDRWETEEKTPGVAQENHTHSLQESLVWKTGWQISYARCVGFTLGLLPGVWFDFWGHGLTCSPGAHYVAQAGLDLIVFAKEMAEGCLKKTTESIYCPRQILSFQLKIRILENLLLYREFPNPINIFGQHRLGANEHKLWCYAMKWFIIREFA